MSVNVTCDVEQKGMFERALMWPKDVSNRRRVEKAVEWSDRGGVTTF